MLLLMKKCAKVSNMYLSRQLKQICKRILLGPKNLEGIGKSGQKLVLILGFILENSISWSKQGKHKNLIYFLKKLVFLENCQFVLFPLKIINLFCFTILQVC